jgi:hypothetical protein
MINRLRRWLASPLPGFAIPLLLLAAGGLAYGLLFLWQGYYWDDYPLTWIASTYSSAGLARYFSTNRPLWGLLYQLSNSLLSDAPWQWQLFGLFWRWLCSVTLWMTLRQVWPRQTFAAVLASLAVLVYPGFGQQPIGMVYGHFFLVLWFFFFSLYASLQAMTGKRGKQLWLALALITSLVNLVTLEYFFLLELVRPLLIAFSPTLSGMKARERILKALKAWLPFALTFLAAAIWRFFFFSYQTFNYQPQALERIRERPPNGLLQLLWTWLDQTWIASIAAWGKAFTLPNPQSLGLLNFALYLLAFLGGLLITLILFIKSAPPLSRHRSGWSRDGLEMAVCGVVAVLIAGWPFFLTDLPVGLVFPNDRFTLPFMLGSGLLLAGLLAALPLQSALRIGLAAALIVPSIGYHFLNATSYRRDWAQQKSFFWQLAWRVPGLAEGTTLLTNDLPLKYYSDNSLTAAVNWIYAPENQTQEMSYLLLYPVLRLGRPELPALQPGLPIDLDYLAARFHGSTDQTVVIYYQPPACLRVLDGEIESVNLFVPVEIREVAARLGSSEWILASPDIPAALPAFLYDPEPAHGWCYYFEKADLARQESDWQQVAALGDQAFSLDDYPNDPSERLPFIEGYAHTGEWERAADLSRQSADVSPAMQPVLCRLWQRIVAQTPESTEKDQISQTMLREFNCSSR